MTADGNVLESGRGGGGAAHREWTKCREAISLTWPPLLWVYFTASRIRATACLRLPREPRPGTAARSPSLCLVAHYEWAWALIQGFRIYLEENVYEWPGGGFLQASCPDVQADWDNLLTAGFALPVRPRGIREGPPRSPQMCPAPDDIHTLPLMEAPRT